MALAKMSARYLTWKAVLYSTDTQNHYVVAHAIAIQPTGKNNINLQNLYIAQNEILTIHISFHFSTTH